MATTELDEIDIGGHGDALAALVRLLARLAAREAWDDGRPGATIRPTTRPRSSASHRRCSHEDQGSLIAAQARLP